VLHPKKVENVVVHEIMNKKVEGEEPLTFSRDTTMEGVQRESTPSSSSEEEFVVSNDNPSDVSRERP
jgi:hypothetical protein